MKKFLSLTIIALIALIALTTSVSAADATVNTEADLKDALLTDGTVKLSGNIEITKSIRTTANVTVDLNGFKITGPDDGVANWYAFIVEGGTFTLKDTSTTQTGEIYAKCYGIETKAGTFIMESGKITATKNTELGAAIVNFGGKVEIKGGTLIAAVWAVDAESYFTDAEVVISGGTFETTTTDAGAVQIGGGLSKYKETASISGGTFKGTNAFAVDSNADTDVSITGGTFDIDVSEYLSEDAKVEKDENGNYVVMVELPKPTNLKWDGTTAKWDAVSNATGYTVMLYNGTEMVEVFSLKDTKLDLSKYLTKEDGKYNFAVFAEGDGKVYLDSQVAASEVYVFPTSEGGQGTAPTTETIALEMIPVMGMITKT